MKKVFYGYRYACDNRGNRYTPSHTLSASYPEWDGLYTMTDERIATNVTTGNRMGWIDVDDSIYDSVVSEVTNKWIGAMLAYMPNSDAILYMDNYTSYPVLSDTVTEKVYEIAPASNETWMDIEQETLTITK